MFHLDFVTLYAVIFLKGTTISIVWCAFALKYRTDSAALNWFQANLLSLLGGAVLISQGAQGRFWPAVFGNTIIVFAFCHYLIGLRRFNDCAGGRIVAIGFSLCAFFAWSSSRTTIVSEVLSMQQDRQPSWPAVHITCLPIGMGRWAQKFPQQPLWAPLWDKY